MFDLEKLFASKGFEALNEESKTLLKDLIKNTEGKSQFESIAIFMEYFNKLKGMGGLEEDTRNKMIETLKEGLNEGDKLKLEMAQRMFKNP